MIAAGYELQDPGASAGRVTCPEMVHVGAAQTGVRPADAGSGDPGSFDGGAGNDSKVELDETTHLVAWSPYVEWLFQDLVAKANAGSQEALVDLKQLLDQSLLMKMQRHTGHILLLLI